MFFEDGIRKIDFILTYTIADKERDEKHADDRDKRIKKRETFLGKFKEYGLEYEIQDCSVSHVICIHVGRNIIVLTISGVKLYDVSPTIYGIEETVM